MTKNPPNHRNTRVSTQPYQGISVDFYFYGMTSDESDQKTMYEGTNGETCWILITDHFNGMKHGDEIISKASPIALIGHFLNQYSSTYNN